MNPLKKLYYKSRIFLRNQYYKSNKIEDTCPDRTALFICIKLLKIEDSLLLIAPVSGDKYIYNERLNIFVSLFGTSGTIVEKNYSHEICLTRKDWDKLEKIFSVEMEKRTKKIEYKVKKGVKDSLSNIYSKIESALNSVSLN
jgi:hypothetical protein